MARTKGSKNKPKEAQIKPETPKNDQNEPQNGQNNPENGQERENQGRNSEIDTIPDSSLPKKDLFRSDEVERYFGISRSTVDRWAEHGILEKIRKGGITFITYRSILNCKFHDKFKKKAI